MTFEPAALPRRLRRPWRNAFVFACLLWSAACNSAVDDLASPPAVDTVPLPERGDGEEEPAPAEPGPDSGAEKAAAGSDAATPVPAAPDAGPEPDAAQPDASPEPDAATQEPLPEPLRWGPDVKVVWDGNSLVRGHGATDGLTLPVQVAALPPLVGTGADVLTNL